MANKYTGDREQLLERIAEAVEAFTGSTPDNTSDRQNATGLALERIAEALENGSGGGSDDESSGGSSGGGETQVIYTITPATTPGEAPTITCNKTFAEIRNIIADGVPTFYTRTVLVDARCTGTLFVGYELSQNLLKTTFISAMGSTISTMYMNHTSEENISITINS